MDTITLSGLCHPDKHVFLFALWHGAADLAGGGGFGDFEAPSGQAE
jgi:hypothetical protein